MLILPVGLASTRTDEDVVLLASKAPIRHLAWAPRGTLLAITDTKVTELPGGRTRSISRRKAEGKPLTPPRLAFSAHHRRGIGDGFMLDLRTLASRPIRRAAWDGDRLVEVGQVSPGKYTMRRRGRQVALAPGWFMLGFSSDLRLALACRKEPFDGDTTFLLRLDPRSGRASVAASYSNASDDHNWLRFVQRGGPNGRILAHSENFAGGLTTPFLAGSRLRSIRLSHPKALLETTAWAK